MLLQSSMPLCLMLLILSMLFLIQSGLTMDNMSRCSMEHWLSMVDCVRNSMDKRSSMRHRGMDDWSSMVDRGMDNRGSMVDSMRFWDIGMSFSLISDISNEPVVMISVVRDNLYTTIRELHTVLTFHNSMLILALCLGKVSAIGISTTILICKRLRGELFLMVWSWVWSWVVGSRGRVVRSRSRGIRSRDCRGTQGRAKEEGNNKDLHAAVSKSDQELMIQIC